MEEDNVKLNGDDDKLIGGVATGGVGFGINNNSGQGVGSSSVSDNGLVNSGLSNNQSVQGGQGNQGSQSGQKDQNRLEAGDNKKQEVGQKVVSLKGVHTESELEKQQRLEEMKKKAVSLDKTEAEIQKEKELEEMKKKAVSLKDGQRLSVGGSQSTVNSGFDQSISGQDKELRGVGTLKTPHPPFREKGDDLLYTGGEMPEARTVITPEGRLVELGAGEEFSGGQNVVNLKKAIKKTGVDESEEQKDVKNVVDLGSVKSTSDPSFEKGREVLKTPHPPFREKGDDPLYAGGEKGKSTPNPSFAKDGNQEKSTPNTSFTKEGNQGGELEEWGEQKVDLSILSPEQRIDLQATPSLASVHWKMDDDLNREMSEWFDKYNKLPVNIKLGLGDRQTVQQAIKNLADKFGVMTEEGLGEISRIVRDVYVDLIGESEIKNRAINNLKISNDKIDDFLGEVAKIVSLVREVGNKKTDEYFRKLSVEEILKDYPKLAEQEVTVGDIFDKRQQKYVAPTVKNWIDDYINNAGSEKHTSLERAKYLEESYNTKYLDEDDRQAVDMLTKSYDTGSKLLVDSQDDVIYWRLHTDESELGINSDKSKRVINNFKIEEAQKVDVDKEGQDERQTDLEKKSKSSIIEDRKNVGGGKDEVLDLSTELGEKSKVRNVKSR